MDSSQYLDSYIIQRSLAKTSAALLSSSPAHPLRCRFVAPSTQTGFFNSLFEPASWSVGAEAAAARRLGNGLVEGSTLRYSQPSILLAASTTAHFLSGRELQPNVPNSGSALPTRADLSLDEWRRLMRHAGTSEEGEASPEETGDPPLPPPPPPLPPEPQGAPVPEPGLLDGARWLSLPDPFVLKDTVAERQPSDKKTENNARLLSSPPYPHKQPHLSDFWDRKDLRL